MQQVDDPPSLPVGTDVSAKYKGAFCEAKVRKVVRNIKVKVQYKQTGLGSGLVPDDAIKSGVLRVGATVEVKHPDRKEPVEAVITKIQDGSQYTVVFDDGDITTLRRTALCLKSGRHFNESETLDQLPLTHPEHFSNPVIGGRRGRRSRHLQDDSSEDEEEPIKSKGKQQTNNEKEEHIGKVICVEANETKKKDKEKWFPGLVVSPTAQVTVKIRVKDEYLVRSFKDGRYYTVPKKEAMEFTRELAAKQDGPAVQAALEYLDSEALPAHWDKDALFGLGNSSSDYEGELDSDSSDDEPREEKDHFVAQLYKYMDDRGTPLNKVPSIQNRDVDLYRLFRTVQKLGGYNKVTSQNQWKSITIRLGFTPITLAVTNLVKQAYKKFLQPYEDFHRKLGCSMLMTPRNASRSKGRSLVRAHSVASPKPEVKDIKIAPATITNQDESENTTSESSMDAINKAGKRKTSTNGGNKVKNLVEKFEEKVKDDIKEKEEKKIVKEKVSVKEKEEKKVVKEKELKDEPTTLISKKEKPIKPIKHEEKRGRKKKEISEPKIVSEKPLEKISSSNVTEGTLVLPTTQIVADFPVEVGDKLKVYYHEKKVTYEAKVIEISFQNGTPLYLVHYTGWNNRYDEWVPRERIAENLTNSKSKKSKSSSLNLQGKLEKGEPSKQSDPNKMSDKSVIKVVTSTSATMNTPSSSKRRGRSDSQPPRSTTPSSVASNSSRTKSPATASMQRRTPRTIPPSTSINRRVSNTVSDISMQTDSDSDSDAPISKKSTRQTTLASLDAKLPSKSNQESETEEDDNAKGRDYDLNQIRSELKGFKEFKSPSPEPNEVCKQQETFEDTDIKSEIKSAPLSKIIKLELKLADLSSETDSFADDDSQSSDKTTQLENMTEKFQQKLKAEKLALVAAAAIKDSKLIKNIKSSTNVPSEKLSPLSSSEMEKIIKDSLAEKRQETLKASTASKPFLNEKSVFTNTPQSIKQPTIIKEEKSPRSQLTRQNSTERNVPQLLEATASTKKQNSPTDPKPIRCDKKLSNSNEKSNLKKEASLSKLPITPPSATASDIITEALNKIVPKLASPPITIVTTSEKPKGIISKEPLLKTCVANQKSSFVVSTSTTTISSSDIYEFKEPEPFEFESRQKTNIVNPTLVSDNSDSTSVKKKKQLPKSYEMLADMKAAQIPQTCPPVVGKKSKKLINKDSDSGPTSAKQSRQIKLEEKRAMQTTVSGSFPHVLSPTQTKDMNLPLSSLNVSTTSTSTSTATTTTTNASPSGSQNSPRTSNIKSTETMFDALRKSPSFNLNISALNEELATTVQETTKALTDVVPNTVSSSPPIICPTSSIPIISILPPSEIPSTSSTHYPIIASQQQKVTKKVPYVDPFIEIHKPAENVFELKQDTKNGSSDDESKLKTELETVKKMLLSDGSGGFDLEPPKIEKPSSIADKVLKALNQKKEEQENKIKEPKVIKEDIKKPCIETPVFRTSPLFLVPNQEPHKLELSSILLKKDLENSLRKPILNSPEHKLDILESIAPKNNDLTETIQKLECAIMKTSNVDHFDDNSSDSTDSESRLVIQDDESGPDDTLSAPEFSPSKKTPVKFSPPKVEEKLPELKKELIFTNIPLLGGGEISFDSVLSEPSPAEILLQPTAVNIPGQNVKNIQPISVFSLQSSLYTPAILNDAGVKPIIETLHFKTESGKLTEIIVPSDELKPVIKKEDLLQKQNDSSSLFLNTAQQDHSHSESINLLLCEETIPGSPQPIIETKPNVHPIESNIKHIPMDIEPSASAAAQAVAVAASAHKICTTTNAILEQQTPPSSSPHDSQSQDDSSEELTKKQFQMQIEGASPKKRRRTRKHSEADSSTTASHSHIKRRRGNQVLIKKPIAGSESDDNSDANTSQRNQQSLRALRPSQYNFLVQLDPALNPNQRISILRKKIGELRKTYNMIKVELASIDRRRKKLRRRDREKKQQQKLQMQSV